MRDCTVSHIDGSTNLKKGRQWYYENYNSNIFNNELIRIIDVMKYTVHYYSCNLLYYNVSSIETVWLLQ